MGMTIEEENKFMEESKEHFKEWHDMNYIPRADYENRLKADLVAMLTEIQLEIEENQIIAPQDTFYDKKLDGQFNKGISKASEIIQQKINALKAESEGKE